MNPFFIILFILLALWLILNLPFILFYLFSGIFSLFPASNSQEEFNNSLVVFDDGNSSLAFLLLPTALFAGLIKIFQKIYHSLHRLFISSFVLYFGWQFLQQVILFGNASKWGFWDWVILIVCSLVILFIVVVVFAEVPAEARKNNGFVPNNPYKESNSKN